jgi:D-alanyl-D-alanine carboxypeptidase (penicillin-binding protein 5/6)
MGLKRHASLAATLMLAILATAPSADAQAPKGKAPAAAPAPSGAATAPVPATQGLALQGAPQITAKSWLLVDVTTGQLLAASDPDSKVEPASLTKLMTAYLVFNALKEKKLALDMRPPVSPHAR